MDTTKHNPWLSQPMFNLSSNHSNLAKINTEEFVILQPLKKCISVHTFNIKQQKWSQFRTNKTEDWPLGMGYICYNHETKQIYATTNELLLVIDMTTKRISATHRSELITPNSKLSIIDGLCHVFFGDDGAHYILDDDKMSSFKLVDQVRNAYENFNGFGLIYRKKWGEVLVFGGHETNEEMYGRKLSDIYKYSLINNLWSMLDVDLLPFDMNRFGYVMTKDERYVIIMGGNTDKWPQKDNMIFIADLDERVLRKSEMTLPFEGECEAILMGNKEENDLLVHGFVKNVMKLNGNGYQMNVPFALISLIAVWHSVEYIHVIQYSSHVKIKLDMILLKSTSIESMTKIV